MCLTDRDLAECTPGMYEDLVNPGLLMTLEEVPGFCDLATCVEELQAFFDVCLKLELYRYCQIIKEKIDAYQTENRPTPA